MVKLGESTREGDDDEKELVIGAESEVKVDEKEWWRPESGLRQRRKRMSDDAIGAVIGKDGFF
ncbi:hypothetical protein TSUD_390900 [Trifolium subterraneum]|uniref:Uncharacterized protein n=1 Tax=Trifolium subterraneum TaxID=3900 RepID=A0A2Z6LXS3_TRISU|nr:hypothetical protein TSUD_390900 [Trifolium subterraneum]